MAPHQRKKEAPHLGVRTSLGVVLVFSLVTLYGLDMLPIPKEWENEVAEGVDRVLHRPKRPGRGWTVRVSDGPVYQLPGEVLAGAWANLAGRQFVLAGQSQGGGTVLGKFVLEKPLPTLSALWKEPDQNSKVAPIWVTGTFKDGRFYLAGGHERDKDGRSRPETEVLSSGQWEGATWKAQPQSFTRLLFQLNNAPEEIRYAAEEGLSPASGGIRLACLASGGGAGIWLGFGSPKRDGRSLFVRLLNPEEAVAGQRARLSEPISLDLRGQEAISVSILPGGEWIILTSDAPPAAGASAPHQFNVFGWSGMAREKPVLLVSEAHKNQSTGTVITPRVLLAASATEFVLIGAPANEGYNSSAPGPTAATSSTTPTPEAPREARGDEMGAASFKVTLEAQGEAAKRSVPWR